MQLRPAAPAPPLRILITDSHSRSALAATRALGSTGHSVFTAGTDKDSLAAVSRFSSGFAQYAAPTQRARSFVDEIAGICAHLKIDVVLPMTELTTLLLITHAERLPAGTRLPFPSAEAFQAASNKHALHKIAESCGVPIPRTEYLQGIEDLRILTDWQAFPLVIKPSHSNVLTPAGWTTMRVSYARSTDEATKVLRALPRQAYPVLLQERIQGAGTAVFTCMTHGRPLVWFAHERLREKPPSGGVSVLCRSVMPDPMAVTYAQSLLERLEWRGVAMIEFKRDDRDGSLRLMEINGRFWGSLQLSISAGINFPKMLVDLATGRSAQAVTEYRLGVENRWLWGDISNLLVQMVRKRRDLNLPPGHPGRLRVLWDFLHLWSPSMRYEVERLNDLAPAWLELRHALRPPKPNR